jgi:hypothetical protein
MLQTPTLKSLAHHAYQAKKDALLAKINNSEDEAMRDRKLILDRLHTLFPGLDLAFELHPGDNTVVLIDEEYYEFGLLHGPSGRPEHAMLLLIRECPKCGLLEKLTINDLADFGKALELGEHPRGCLRRGTHQ